MTLPATALPIESPLAFLGVAHSATGKLWRDRLDARGAARALAIVQRYQLPEMLARVLAGRDVELAGVARMSEATSGAGLSIDGPRMSLRSCGLRQITSTSPGGLSEIGFVAAGIAGPVVRQQAFPDITTK